MPDGASQRNPMEIVAEEFAQRIRRGERPSIEEYVARYPRWANELRDLLEPVAVMEGVKQSRREAASPPPKQVGDYRIVREIGRGGMGIVYEAVQESLGRRVALKVLPAASLLDAKRLERFEREAQAAARLHHTNIVPVFGTGEQDGLHYYVMQYIEGQGLDRVLQELKRRQASGDTAAADATPPLPAATIAAASLPSASANRLATQPEPSAAIKADHGVGGLDRPGRERWLSVARIGLEVADALAYAHSQATLHRDIKPANLLLDARGSVWITDFGLAKWTDNEGLTETGDVLGTLQYMAPERFQGQCDARADVYGLGLSLYELATLSSPFGPANGIQQIEQARKSEPRPPRQIVSGIPRDLETIILKSIAREPGRRYQSAADLVEDLKRFIEDRPILARRASMAERLWRWCRRNPAVAALSSVAAALLVLAAVTASVGYIAARSALKREFVQHQEADHQRARAESNLGLAMEAFDRLFVQLTGRLRGARAGAMDDASQEAAVPPPPSPELAALLQDLLKFYDRFGQQNAENPALERQAADAHRRVGDIHERLGQSDQAEAAYGRSAESYARLAAGPPPQPALRVEQASVLNQLGLVRRMKGSRSEGLDAHRQAIATLSLLPVGAEGAAARYQTAWAHLQIGEILAKSGRMAEAGAEQRAALDLLAGLIRENPNESTYRYARALANRELAVTLWAADRRQEAIQATSGAIETLEELVAQHPDQADYRYDLAETCLRMNTQGRGPAVVQEALRRFQRALTLADALAAQEPGNSPDYEALRVRCHSKLASAMRSAGELSDAEMHARRSSSLAKALLSRFPDVPSYRLYLADASLALAEVLRDGRQPAAARTVIEESLTSLEQFLARAPPSTYGRNLQVSHYRLLEAILMDLGEKESAVDAARKAMTSGQRQ